MTATERHATVLDRTSTQRRRRMIMSGLAAVVLAGGLATVVTLRQLDHQYGPIQDGNFAGLYSDRNFVFSKDGFSYSLSPTPGVTAELIASVANLGSHSVKITSIGRDRIVTDIRWSSYRFVSGGSGFGLDTPWHPFPAIVPAHGTLRLLITIHHPSDCKAYPPGASGLYYNTMHQVHWESLLHDHSTWIDDGLSTRNIRVC